jgi:hypothetical protein
MAKEFADLDNTTLLRLWSRVMTELHDRGVVRSSNNPLGDYCEELVAAHYGVKPVGGSNAGFDLTTPEEVLVQVKSRRLTARRPHVGHFSVMHGFDEHSFDEVAAVVLNEDFTLREAWSVPWQACDRHKRWNKANQGWVLAYTRRFLADPDIRRLDLALT